MDRVIVDAARTSASLFRLSHGSERMWWRNLLVCDRLGRFEADPPILRANCFPRWGDRIRDDEVEVWRDEWVGADLVLLYIVRGRAYGLVHNFTVHQPYRFRRDRIRFPAPPAECPVPVNGGRPGGRPPSHHAVGEDTADRAAEVLRAPARSMPARVVHSRAVRGTSDPSNSSVLRSRIGKAVRGTSVQSRAPACTSVQLSTRDPTPSKSEQSAKTRVGGFLDLDTHETPPRVSTDSSLPPPIGFGAFIARLVAVYPRPANLPAVERAVHRLVPDATVQDAILAAVDAQKRWPTLARENGRYFPDLDKWLRNRKWLDQPPQLHRGETRNTAPPPAPPPLTARELLESAVGWERMGRPEKAAALRQQAAEMAEEGDHP